MVRISAAIMMALVTLGGASAATIFAPTAIDLTKTSANLATCSGAGCTPTTGSFTTGTYMNNLFTGIMSAGSPTPSAGLQPFPTNTGITTLPLIIDQQPASPFNDVWYSSNTTNTDSTLVLNLGGYDGTSGTNTLGLFEVDKVWTMIQANLQGFGVQNVVVTLKGVAADGTTAISDTIVLTSGIDYRGTSSGASVTCDDATAVGGSSATSCTGASSATAQVSGTNSAPGGSSTPGNTVITYNNVYSGNLSGTNYWLDVQELDLPSLGNTGSFAGGYLDSISIANLSSGTGTSKQRLYFSGLTVDQATPEPGTIGLFVAGLGLLSLGRLRSRARQS